MSGFTGAEWAGILVAATGFLTMCGKGLWTVFQFFWRAWKDRETAAKAAIEAKNSEIAELRQLLRDLSPKEPR